MYASNSGLQQVHRLGCHLPVMPQERLEGCCGLTGMLPCRRGRKRWILSVPVRGAVRMDAGAVRAVEARGKSLFSAGLVGVTGDFSAQDAVQLCDAAGRELGRGLCNYSAAEVERIKVGIPSIPQQQRHGRRCKPLRRPAALHPVGTELACCLCNDSAIAETDSLRHVSEVLISPKMTGNFSTCCRLQGLSSKDFVTELGYLGCEEIFHRDNICLLQRPHSNPSEANLAASGEQQADSALVNGLSSDDERGRSSPDNGTPSSQT